MFWDDNSCGRIVLIYQDKLKKYEANFNPRVDSLVVGNSI